MSAAPFAVVALAHAASSWLATALLLFTALGPASPSRRGRLPAALVTSLAGALGLLLHLPYRARVRQSLFLEARDLALLFERKDHLAFGVLALAWVAALLGAAAARVAREGEVGRPLARELERGARAAGRIAAALAVLCAVAGVVVASSRRF